MQDKEKFIQQTGRQMLNLVTNMIDVYKSEYAKLELNISETSLQKLINQALGEVDFLVNYKDLKVKLSLDKNVVVQVDKEIIKRVFVNLFTNAIKFSPQNGIITVESIVNSDDGLRICIENQGYGIPKENQETIFELYKQDKRMDSGAAPSSGLGLAFCKMAVEAHNGKIGVISESETGVEFWITLPKYQVSKTPIKNVKTEVYQELDLSESDKEYLLPFINQIMTFNIFEISSINSVLKSIDNKNSNIENWVEELTEVLYSGNEDRYNRLIRL
jgi:K+-sensing histidine kinase KdpD